MHRGQNHTWCMPSVCSSGASRSVAFNWPRHKCAPRFPAAALRLLFIIILPISGGFLLPLAGVGLISENPHYLERALPALTITSNLLSVPPKMDDGREDPNLILIVRGKWGAPADALGLPHNSERSIVSPVLPPQCKPKPRRRKTALKLDLEEDSDSFGEDDEAVKSLQLTFTKPPTDITRGFLFGTDKKRCDVLLAEQKSRGISGVHFVITFDEEGRLVLKDVSTKQTSVSYDDKGAKHWRRGFKWILFIRKTRETHIHLPNGLCLDIILPSHDSCQHQYQANVKAYLEASSDSSLALGGLNVPSQDPTRPRTPIDDPIYLPIATIGAGAYGTVSEVVDVSTGLTYASKTLSESFDFDSSEKKEFERKEFEKEMQLMKNLVHVWPFIPHYSVLAPRLTCRTEPYC